MFVTKKHLSRRAVLRGAGATLALPLLDCMVPALTALSRTAAAPARLRRLGVFYVPNGMSMGYWWPRAEGPLQELPPTLQSLAPLKDRSCCWAVWPTSRPISWKGAATTRDRRARS